MSAVTASVRLPRSREIRFPSYVPNLVAVAVFLGAGAIAASDGFWVLLLTSAAVSYVLIGSYNVIFGAAGLFSLAHAALYAVGAYASVILETTYGWPLLLAAAAAVALAVLVGVLVAIPTARLEGAFLALGTLAFATAASAMLVNWTGLTGGAQGFLGILPPRLFGYDFIGGTLDYYWLAGAVAVVCFAFFRGLAASALGRRFVALRESEVSAQASGIDPVRTRILAFAVSSFFAGLAGVLYARLALFISPETFALHTMIQILIITLLGGAGYLYGPVVAVAVEVAVNQVVQQSGDGGQLVFGLAVILVIAFAPSGVMGQVERLWRRRRRVEATAEPAAEPTADTPAEVRVPPPREVVRGARLRVRDVELRFAGVVAAQDVDVDLAPGEVVGLIGPNGAGKTSLVNVITGAVRPQRGSVTLGERELVARKPFEVAREGVARTFQNTHLVPSFDLETNVVLGQDGAASATLVEDVLRLPRSRKDEEAARRTARELLALVGVADYADVRAADAPYGVLRRAEIAKALALRPAFLLLDEPGAGLSSYERDEVTEAVHAVAATGVGCLLIDHNVSFVAQTCRRLVVLAAGRVLTQGGTAEVLAHPDVVTAYLGRTAIA